MIVGVVKQWLYYSFVGAIIIVIETVIETAYNFKLAVNNKTVFNYCNTCIYIPVVNSSSMICITGSDGNAKWVMVLI